MRKYKTDMNITKIDKYKKKMSRNSMQEHKTDISIIKIEKCKNLNIKEHKTDTSIT